METLGQEHEYHQTMEVAPSSALRLACVCVAACAALPWPSRCSGVSRCVCLGASCPKDRLSMICCVDQCCGASAQMCVLLVALCQVIEEKHAGSGRRRLLQQVDVEALRSSPLLLRQRGTVVHVAKPYCGASAGKSDGFLEVSVV